MSLLQRFKTWNARRLAARNQRDFAAGKAWAEAEIVSGRLTPIEVPYHLDGAVSDAFIDGAMAAVNANADVKTYRSVR